MRAVHRNLFILLLLVVLASSKTPDSDLCKTKEKEGDIDYYCDNSPIFVCKDYGKDKYCVHKGVFPAEWRELLGALILAVAISLCNAAGIGGGGIIVTINVTLFQFSAKESIAMSNFVIFFGCLTRYIRNFKNKHPLKDATAIDYGIVTCQMPLVMLGTFIGVQINEILPETLVFILLFVTLLYLTYKAFMKAIDAYKKEKKIAQEKKEQKDEERVPLRDATRNINGTKENVGSREDMFQPLMQHNDKDKLSQTHDNGSGPLDIKLNPLRQSVRENSRQSIARGERIENDTQGIENEDKELLIGERRSTYKLDELNSKLKMYLKLEKSHFRIRTILIVLLPFLTITIFALLRGTKTFDSIAGPNFGRCTVSDYIFLAAEIVILFILSGVNIMLLKREYQDKLSCGYQFVKGDIVWDSKSIVRFVLFAIIAGFISGAVGLSGGILFTPLFLDFGVPPTVASGTSMFMAMFATLSSTIMFMFNGYIIYDFAFWLAFFSVVGTAAGITIIGGAVKKSGKTQILVWLLAFVILASCIADGVVGLLETIDTPKGEMFKFRSYCPEDKDNMFMFQ